MSIDVLSTVTARESDEPLGYVSGRALAHGSDLELFDVVFLLDTSGSTSRGSGLSEEELGEWLADVGELPRGLRGSVLAAEVAAVEALLNRFDPRTTRVGVVSFSGGVGGAPARRGPSLPIPLPAGGRFPLGWALPAARGDGGQHAWVEVPLTADYQRVRRALADLLMVGPEGDTDMRAGLQRAGIELLGNRSAESEPRSGASRHIVLLTDGEPTFPRRDPEGSTIRRAHKLKHWRVRVHAFAIGSYARRHPRVLREVAEATSGSHAFVDDLRQLPQLLAQIDFAELREVRVRNLTVERPAREVLRNPDGTYGALVPVSRGPNRIEVVAVTHDGRQHRVERTLVLDSPELTARQRNEQERLMQIAIEQDKATAERERQLEIEVDRESDEPPASAGDR